MQGCEGIENCQRDLSCRDFIERLSTCLIPSSSHQIPQTPSIRVLSNERIGTEVAENILYNEDMFIRYLFKPFIDIHFSPQSGFIEGCSLGCYFLDCDDISRLRIDRLVYNRHSASCNLLQ